MLHISIDMYKELLSRRGLSLDRLHNFCLIADAGGIAKAAKGAPGKQSLYSRQIRELEEFFGVELTRRRGRRVALTEAGNSLARLIREQLQALVEFKHSCRSQPVPLTIVAGNSVLEWAVSQRLPKLCADLPNVQVTLISRRTDDIRRDLLDLKADLGILRQNAIAPRLKNRPFCVQAYALFVPAQLAGNLSDKQVVAKLDTLPLALVAGGTFRVNFLTAASRVSLAPRIIVSCSSFTQAATLVETGSFATVLPTLAACRITMKSCRVIQLPFLERQSRKLVIAWNPRLAAVRPLIIAAAESLSA